MDRLWTRFSIAAVHDLVGDIISSPSRDRYNTESKFDLLPPSCENYNLGPKFSLLLLSAFIAIQ